MISIQGTEMDFGEMQFGKSYTQKYQISNRGDKSLKITGLGQSCTCTKVWIDSDILQPKQTGQIHVTVTPGSTGIFLRSFWFNAGSHHTVKLKGHVS